MANNKIDWFVLPYKHSWHKTIPSIMNPTPGVMVTQPQFLAEAIISIRCDVMKVYSTVRKGPGWSAIIMKQVRSLNQQASVICNYFPQDGLSFVAMKNWLRRFRPLKIGQYRKVRFTEKNGKKRLNICQDEIDVVSGIFVEYERLLQQQAAMLPKEPILPILIPPDGGPNSGSMISPPENDLPSTNVISITSKDDIIRVQAVPMKGKMTLAQMMELEKKLKTKVEE